ncbi:DEAD/DEAH box helicase [Massilia sp. W12]|uniref:preprotein translocase subunit SecA n=1 Tax=Massilia sp. W12 TaxID=3126507 RepID=UPI0030CED706
MTTNLTPIRLPLRLLGKPRARFDNCIQEWRPNEDEGWSKRIVDCIGLLPVERISRKKVNNFNQTIKLAVEKYQGSEKSIINERFYDLLQSVQTGNVKLVNSSLLPEILACIGIAAKEKLGIWPHPVQFFGAKVLMQGRLAEMKTGEGKSLVAAITATVMAGAGFSVHIISTNDYLAQRDCEEMNELFKFFGLRSSYITNEMNQTQRREAYRAHICYVSGKEVVFDYLKDKNAGHGVLPASVETVRRIRNFVEDQNPVLSNLHFAIIDEADSVLIDEARTPMILSRQAGAVYENQWIDWAINSAKKLQTGTHYSIDPVQRNVELYQHALDACFAAPNESGGIFNTASAKKMLIKQALSALFLYQKNKHYLIHDGKIKIIDESTGRVMPDRSWSQGLHQLLEAKENVDITPGRETLGRMTFQKFFQKYFVLSGLSGTAREAANELWCSYRIKVVCLPTNLPGKCTRLPDQFLADSMQKWKLVAEQACQAASKGQAVLIGARSVEASESLSAVFTNLGVPHTVLNARQDAHEAQIIAQAGQSGRITVATNMAGRGTDIKLDESVRLAGGLFVILTEYHESARVDRQLFGRAARQGEPGLNQAIIACDTGLPEQLPFWIRKHLLYQPKKFQQIWKLWIRIAQIRCERQARRERMLMIKQELSLHRLLGFTGGRK